MKRSQKTPPRATSSRGTTSPGTISRARQRNAPGDLTAQILKAPKHSPAPAENRLGASADIDRPLSLNNDAGRQYFDEVLRLFAQIRTACDTAAERLGVASAKDDGLAAVEYIANKIMQSVRGERQRRTITIAKTQSAPKPLQVQSVTQSRHKSDKQASQPPRQAERAKLIGELKQMLRDGRTTSGIVIDPQLAHEIAKQITVLNDDIADTPQSTKRIRDNLARLFQASGKQQKRSKVAAAAVAKKPKRAKRARAN